MGIFFDFLFMIHGLQIKTHRLFNRKFNTVRRNCFIYCFLLLLPSLFPLISYGQGVFWKEDFGNTGACDAGTGANNFATANGIWTVISTGTNDNFANQWYISASEAGQPIATCSGNSCLVNASLIDRTLHIGNVAGSPFLSGVCPNGDCGATYDIGNGTGLVNTHRRAVSPNISCVGKSNIGLKFYYTEGGDNTTDNGTVWYSFDSGVTWIQLADPPKTATCPTGAYWTPYYATLPASANNNANVKIGFDWVNNDDAAGSQPSFAIDSILLGQLPVASFITSATNDSACVGSVIAFYDKSTGVPTGWQWNFAGGNPATSLNQNPIILFDSVGDWTVTLTVTNDVGSSTISKVIHIHTCLPPKADFLVSRNVVCQTTCVSFADLSSNIPTSWQWTFQGGTPSTSTLQNPQTVCYNVPGTYDVQLIASNIYGKDTMTKFKYIVVTDTCARPIANFSATQDTICNFTCINFIDSTKNTDSTTTYRWYFPGAVPDSVIGFSTPSNICYDTDGTYDVTLVVTSKLTGTDTLTKTGYIVVRSVPGSYIRPDTAIYYGQQIKLYAGGGYSYHWLPDSVVSPSDTDSIVTAQPLVTTTYTCIVTDSAGNCYSIKTVTIFVLHISKVFVPNTFTPDDPAALPENKFALVFGNNIAGIRFIIYDRWGEKLFESSSTDVGWDGTYNGRKCMPGVYVYNLLATFIDGKTLNQNGNITLIR